MIKINVKEGPSETKKSNSMLAESVEKQFNVKYVNYRPGHDGNGVLEINPERDYNGVDWAGVYSAITTNGFILGKIRRELS